FFVIFFFSSRRRHTRWPRDWSSDVCSSDLLRIIVQPQQIQSWIAERNGTPARRRGSETDLCIAFDKPSADYEPISFDELIEAMRSEERRVGKECRSRWSQEQEKTERNSRNE